MSSCSDYWCEHYGKNNEKCGQCLNKQSNNGNNKDKPELRVILKRRADKMMGITDISGKGKGQSH